MRKITKGQPPHDFAEWVSKKPKNKSNEQRYNQLFDDQCYDILSSVSMSCAKEQFFICAYCCQAITGQLQDTRNEHVQPRNPNSNKDDSKVLDYNNFVASCKTKNQCDDHKANQHISLTPFMLECETELRFKISGRVEGLTDRAKETINVLNLGDNNSDNRSLIEKRSQLIAILLWQNYGSPEEFIEEDDIELLEILKEQLNQINNGKLEPFAPVLVNILQSRINDLTI